ncbi:MAG TPA: acetyl-CoA C-acetyltransferase [Bacillota bacterium]|jgi:acetyl-CoA C-acetyltransferase|nr:acetyl-CoA C-acetyltransferase [Bacillota bacterium]HOA35269.1 acetyl-CoA C-acetyltransferase [Bacillota bacterium]HOL15896.1 acetyl-CoA C-acetyltransferase [Bacillota bacterium]HPZ11301.1 acetyl-CoA C-acetyltransferase [Bacillota bacterium]HQE09442.1 acetyl-CoA C-acetyltransferase [Bacillota bacterium]
MQREDVVIVGARRTAIGDFGGCFREVSSLELAVAVVEELVRGTGLDKRQIDEVIFGNCNQRSDEPNIARCIALAAEMPVETTGFTIQRQCSSGMQAIVSAYHEIVLGDAEIVVAGGVESMSTAPYLLKGARWGQRLQHGEMTDSLWEMLTDPVHKIMMGETAERLADKYGISREEQDEIAYRSHSNAAAAREEGRFRDEIVPVTVKGRRGETVVDADEHPRKNISREDLARLRPVFRPQGTVTAGNSSGLNDGAAAVVVMPARRAAELGLKPMGRIVSYAWAGVEPDLMGYGPVPAIRKALQRAGLTLAQVELIELNEAFAAQYLACEKLLDLNRDIVNVNGSGIGLGHPVGATGTRIVVTLLHEMARRNLKLGLASLCVGGGMGMALILERP